jgi:N utilization substance protein B
MASTSRRQARIIALQTLYEVDSTDHLADDVLRRNLIEPASDGNQTSDLEPSAREFASTLVDGVLENRADLDKVIAQSAPSWPIDQMSKIDKNILRLAIFEILFDNRVPLKAAINEAVELGKRFGSDSSSRFINGVLGTVASSISSGKLHVAKRPTQPPGTNHKGTPGEDGLTEE